MTERFAIYFAPAAESALWRRASSWLGRDALTGESLAQPQWTEIAADAFSAATESPRLYGFHATLKAPMRLAEGATSEGLCAALADFAAATSPLPLGRPVVRPIGSFLALVCASEPLALTALAGRIVEHFELFRAPLSPQSRARRLAAGLSPRQVELLDRYGYPYVLEQFRFHMTLSGKCDDSLLSRLSEAAGEWFGPALETALLLDRFCLFHQQQEGAPFRRIEDFRLTGPA